MEDHRLKAFCLVVEMKSFSKAAEAKFMTQSAMSHLIRSLEEELGVRLLHRHAKTVTPTPAGRHFYGHARRILQSYREMENDIYDIVHIAKGPLHIGASTTVGTYILPQVFYDFSRNYPDIALELTVSNTEGIIDDLHHGKIDLGIVEGKLRASGIVPTEIASDEIVVIASEDNPLTKRKGVVPRDLASQPFILPEPGSGTREFLEDYLRATGIEPRNLKIAMTLGNPEVIVQMVQSGLGISFVSKWSIFRAMKEGTVRIVNLTGKTLRRKFYLIHLEGEPSTVTAKAFTEFLRDFRFFAPF